MQKLLIVFMVLLINMLSVNCEEASAASLSDLKTIGFRHIELPENVRNEEIVIKSLYFTLKDEAEKLKKVTLNYDPAKKETEDGYVVVNLYNYDLVATWIEPSAGTTRVEEWSEKSEWTDNKGKKHKQKVTRYTSEPFGVPGKYSFTAYVNADVSLISAKTGEVLFSYSGSERNDKEIDGYKKIIKDFYKKLNKKLKETQE